MTFVVLAAITLASWIVVMARDMYGTMLGASASMMTTDWDWPRLALLCAEQSARASGAVRLALAAWMIWRGMS